MMTHRFGVMLDFFCMYVVWVCVFVCMLCASTFSYPGLCFKHIQYVPWTCASWSVFTLSSTCISHYAGAGRFTVLMFYCGDQYLFVCLFICLGSNTNMTMCALDTRNDSKGDANAVSFCNSTLSFHHSFSILLLYIIVLTLTGGVCHITTIQIVPQNGWF